MSWEVGKSVFSFISLMKGSARDLRGTQAAHSKKKYQKAGDADSPSLLALADYFTHFEHADATSWEWIRWQEKSVAQVWHTKYGVCRRKEKADVRDEPMLGQQ